MVILMKSHHPRARTKPRMPPTTVKATPASLRNCAFRLTPSRRSSSSRTGAIAGNSEDEADREEERQGKQFSKRLKMRRVLSEVESNHSSQSRLLEQDEDSQAILGILERSTSYERHKRKHTDACGGDPNGSAMAWESAPAVPPPGQLLARSSSISIDRSLPGMPRPKKKGSFMSQQVCSRCAPPHAIRTPPITLCLLLARRCSRRIRQTLAADTVCERSPPQSLCLQRKPTTRSRARLPIPPGSGTCSRSERRPQRRQRRRPLLSDC